MDIFQFLDWLGRTRIIKSMTTFFQLLFEATGPLNLIT